MAGWNIMTEARRVGAFFLAVGLCLAFAGAALAASPSSDPILRIEIGRHTAVVTHLAMNADQTVLATASLDKTVRLWSFPDGRLNATLRVPIGDGPEGSLYSTALSPDGKTLLASGYTGGSWDGTYSIYVFDVDRRQLKARLSHLPDLANDLAFSPDGTVFAAVFSGHGGFAVWNAADGKLLREDKDYADVATALCFDRSGRVATVSRDGFIRLYDAAYKLVVKTRTAGRKPLSAAFSPDGTKLAVGYEDVGRVDVLTAAATAKPLYSVDSRGLTGGNLAAVAWSADGRDLMAAGSARDKAGKVVVRRWGDGGSGAARDVEVARDAVMHLFAPKAGGVLFASADPSWGWMNGEGKLGPVVDGQIADFRDIADGRFGLSEDGTIVDFGLGQGGKRSVRADLVQLKLTADPPGDPHIDRPAASAGKISVSDWKNAPRPKLNGRPVALHPGELARSVAVLPGGDRVLLGTSEGLKLLDARGQVVASVVMPGEVWGIAAARLGKVAVAALGDGTLRWVSLDGPDPLSELAVLFVRGDGSRWMAWTHEGFFAHSDGGNADIVGYQINHGARSTPEWVEFDRLYQLFYAPELIARKVNGSADDEIRAKLAKIGSITKVLGERPAPSVELVEYCPLSMEGTRGLARADLKPSAGAKAGACVSVEAAATRGFSRQEASPSGQNGETPIAVATLPAGTNGIRLRFKVSDRQGGIGDVDIFVNGRLVDNTRGFGRAGSSAPRDGVRERDIGLPPGRNEVWVRAYNEGNAVDAVSTRVDFIVAARNEDAPLQAATKPRLMILAAGIDRYGGPNALRFAVKDMHDVVQVLERKHAASYGDIQETVLNDSDVTVGNLEKAFDRLAREAGPDDTVFLYFAGHGFVDDRQNTSPYYFITSETDIDRLDQTAFSQFMFKSNLAKIPTRNIFLLLDTCHSGALKTSVIDKIHEDFGKSFYILGAASADQTALDSYKGINGPFAYAVIEGLNGEASDKRGSVSQIGLGAYVTMRVPELVAEQNPRHTQKAVFKFGGDGGELSPFPLSGAAQ